MSKLKVDSIALIKTNLASTNYSASLLSKRNRANVALMLIGSPTQIVTVCALNPGVDYLHVTASRTHSVHTAQHTQACISHWAVLTLSGIYTVSVAAVLQVADMARFY